MHYKEPIAKLIATAKPSFWRSLPSPPSSLRSPAMHSEGPPDLLHVSAAYFFKYVVAAATGWLRQPSLPVRFRSPAFALPSSLFAHLLLHCEGSQDLLVSKAATGPSRVESSHRTFFMFPQP